MSTKTATKAEGEAMPNAQGTDTALVPQGAEALSVAQVAATGLSQETAERLSIELREKLAQLTMGIDEKIAAGKILQRGDAFNIIDATIIQYTDKATGEESDKHIFVLEFPQGDIQVIMQSDSDVRRRLSSTFQDGRALGLRVVCGPYKMIEKQTGKPQPALIFEKQPGFAARAVA